MKECTIYGCIHNESWQQLGKSYSRCFNGVVPREFIRENYPVSDCPYKELAFDFQDDD